MNATCYQLPPSVAEEMLQVAARAICDRPGESPAQRDSRTQQMVHMIRAMQPRDGLEYMLSILAVGHFNLVLDSMREAFLGQPKAAKASKKSTIVALHRSFSGAVRELRLSRKRPSAELPGEARTPGGATKARNEVTQADAARSPMAEASPLPTHENGLERAPPAPLAEETADPRLAAQNAAGPLKLPASGAEGRPGGSSAFSSQKAKLCSSESLHAIAALEKAMAGSGKLDAVR
jgi:hypothetical protein